MSAVLFSQMTPEPAREADFHDWYDSEHIAERLAIPGFRAAARFWVVGDGPKHAALYDLDSLDALDSPAYRGLKDRPSERTARILGSVHDFTRYAAEELDRQGDPAATSAPILFTVLFAVPPERAEEFERWYREEHMQLLLRCPTWLLCRSCRIRSGEPARFTHLGLHHLADLSALESPEREVASNTPWRLRLAAEPWYRGSATRAVYRRLKGAP